MISLPVFGLSVLLPYGLALGVCAAVISLNVISSSIDRAVAQGRRTPVMAGLILRIVLYAGALVLAANTGSLTMLGAAIGMLIPHLVIYAIHAIIPAVKRKMGKTPAPVYVTDTRSKVFFKDPWLVKYRKGRAYLTHRHFRKVNINKELIG